MIDTKKFNIHSNATILENKKQTFKDRLKNILMIYLD